MSRMQAVEKGQRSLTALAYAVTIFFTITAVIPVLWMITSSLQTDKDIETYPPKWTPSILRSMEITIDYTGMDPMDSLAYEKDAMRATWYPWMKNIRESIGEIKVTGLRDGKLLYRTQTTSSSFRAGQSFVVPSTLFTDEMMDVKLPIIHERELSSFNWYGDKGREGSSGNLVAQDTISSKLHDFYASTTFVKGKVTAIQSSAAWTRMFDSYLSLNRVAEDTSGSLGFFRYFLNSGIVTLSTVAIQLFFGSFAGYALSHLIQSRKWQYLWLMFFLATIMIPGISLLLPLYLLMKQLGLINSLLAVILPHSAWGIVIYLFKGFFDQLPKELMQAARVDGASEFHTFSRIAVPMSIPIFTTVSVLTFVPVWNEFVWPLVVNNLPEYWTFTVALNDLQNKTYVQQNMVMASSVLSMVPLFIIFMVSQKYIEKGIAFSGVKG